MTAGIHDVEGSGPTGPHRAPSVTVFVPTKNAVRTFDLELVVVPRHLGYRRPFEAAVRVEDRLTTAGFASAAWVMLVTTLAVFRRLRVSRWYEAPRMAGAPVIVHPLSGAVEVPEQ